MSIEVKCPQCGSIHRVNDRLVGRRIRCPQCDNQVEVLKPEVVEVIDDPYDTVEGIEIAVPVAVGPSLAKRSEAQLAASTNGPPVAVDDDEVDDDLPIKIKPEDGELDMTPMVDVTFLLLIFFMITAAFSLQKSVESPRQQSDAPSSAPQEQDPEEQDVVTVQINELGTFLVLAADWERETPGKQNLILALRDARGDPNNPAKLMIEVHEMARLQALVDCMDAGSTCEYNDVQVTQVDGFE